MKNIFFCLLCLVFTLNGFSQSTSVLSKEDYLKKSKEQRITAIVLVGLGALAIGASAANSVNSISLNSNAGSNNSTGLFLLGVGIEIISIPVFLSASRNKKKAMNMVASIELEKLPLLDKVGFAQTSAPVFSVQMRF